MKDFSVLIDELSERRRALWADPYHDPHEVAQITKQLTDLYEEKRIESARVELGGRTRAEIVRQARVESELERLISR